MTNVRVVGVDIELLSVEESAVVEVVREPFAKITFPNHDGTVSKKGLGRPAAEFYGVPDDAPIKQESNKWWDDWVSVTVDGNWYGEPPKKKKGGRTTDALNNYHNKEIN